MDRCRSGPSGTEVPDLGGDVVPNVSRCKVISGFSYSAQLRNSFFGRPSHSWMGVSYNFHTPVSPFLYSSPVVLHRAVGTRVTGHLKPRNEPVETNAGEPRRR